MYGSGSNNCRGGSVSNGGDIAVIVANRILLRFFSFHKYWLLNALYADDNDIYIYIIMSLHYIYVVV